MAHIAFCERTTDDDGATWMEHVTDQQYADAATYKTAPRITCSPSSSRTLPSLGPRSADC